MAAGILSEPGSIIPPAVFSTEFGYYRYTAPDGYSFAGDLHEFVYDRDAWTKREALKDARERERAEPLGPCVVEDCDWCHSEPQSQRQEE